MITISPDHDHQIMISVRNKAAVRNLDPFNPEALPFPPGEKNDHFNLIVLFICLFM